MSLQEMDMKTAQPAISEEAKKAAMAAAEIVLCHDSGGEQEKRACVNVLNTIFTKRGLRVVLTGEAC